MLVSRTYSLAALAVISGLAACGGGDGNKPIDAAIDGRPIDANCDYTGEIVDWGSTTSAFCGVFQATATVRGNAALTNMTNPNGRFQLCLQPSQTQTLIDITPPAGASQCNPSPGTYMTPGVLALDPGVASANALSSVRLITQDTLTNQFNLLGQAYQPSHGQLVVHIIGTAKPVTITSDAMMSCVGIAQFNGTAWQVVSPPTSGTDVLFANCFIPPDGTTTVDVMLDGVKKTTVTMEPNKFTYVSIVSP